MTREGKDPPESVLVMERPLVATANSPMLGQPGQTSGEGGVKTPWAWDQNRSKPGRRTTRRKDGCPPARVVGRDGQVRRDEMDESEWGEGGGDPAWLRARAREVM